MQKKRSQPDHMSSTRLAHAAAMLATAGADVFASCISTAVEVASCSVPPAPAAPASHCLTMLY